ncbi:MAG: trigger factor [Clostridia bacterium]|nr:trigger factor [Clostridia bacterium]
MNYKVEKTEKNELRTSIELTKEEWVAANKKAYEKNKSKYSVPGFRKGHVPYNYLVKTYGEQIFFEDAINIAFGEHYFDIIDKEADYAVIDGPSVEDIKMTDEGGITIIALAPLKPEVKLGKYKGIKIEKVEYNVTDEDVENEISKLRERNSREVEVTDRAVEDGDICDIDFSGSIDNVKFEGGTAEHHSLKIGSKTFIPGFEEQIIGMNIGGERDITVKFPEDYPQETLAGKEAVFAIKLHGIKVKELPEVDDEFIKDATGEESVEAYKTSVRAKLQKSNDEKAKHEMEDKLMKIITDASEVVIP